MHQPFAVLVKKREIFGRQLFEFLDANENTTKSYACFLAKIPKDYLGVNKVTFEGDSLVIVEREKEIPLKIRISTGGLMF